MRFWLKIEDSLFHPTMKEVKVEILDDEKGIKRGSRKTIITDFMPLEIIKENLKESIMKAFGEELDKYLNSAFNDKEKEHGTERKDMGRQTRGSGKKGAARRTEESQYGSEDKARNSGDAQGNSPRGERERKLNSRSHTGE